MRILLLDIETNGLNPDTIHCAVTQWYGEDKQNVYSNTYDKCTHTLEELSSTVDLADRVVAHNGCGFDFIVLKKLLGIDIPRSKMFDTLAMVQLLCPQVYEKSIKVSMPSDLRDKHSLKAWGFRLKVYKGDYYGGWDSVNDDMVDYCKKDVDTLSALYKWGISKNYPENALATEMELAPVLGETTNLGFMFDYQAAEDLYIDLIEKRYTAKMKLRETFPPRYVAGDIFIPKVNNHGYTKGAMLTKIEYEEFNPNSRIQIIDRLVKLYGWKPREFSEKGNATLDKDVLGELPYTEAKVLDNYFVIQKRIAQLIEGKQGWMKCADDNGRIHGSYMQCGTISGRASHFAPNLGQVPNTSVEYGEECRKLFIAPKGKVLVGVDMSGLELRCFAGYVAPYDKGEAIQTILHGSSEAGNDIYSIAGNAVNKTRKVGKTLVLAMLYGAANKKLAWTVDPLLDADAATRYGKQIRENISTEIAGFEQLRQAVISKIRQKGYVIGLDGRMLYPRSEHAALNILLQSAGAILSKRWVIIMDNDLRTKGLDAKMIAWVHDEVVVECAPEIAKEVEDVALAAIIKAGEFYNFACPLAGEGKIGSNWLEVH